MPIKFRCVHCGQYLGISHSKAGTVVDCPTCGRSVGVPHEDGTAERVGRPSLNHDDSQLADALREVAAIAGSSEMAIPQPPPASDHSSDARETREVDSLPPQVVPTSPLPPVEPISVDSLPDMQQPNTKGNYSADASQETYYSQGPSPLDHLTALADGEGESEEIPQSAVGADDYFPSTWTNEVPWKMWLGFIVIGFVAVISGFALGRWDLKIGRREEPVESVETKEKPSVNHSPVVPITVGSLPNASVAFTATVKYAESEKDVLTPDENAWIYAFPVERAGDERIPAEWLKTKSPSDYQTGHQLFIAALRVMGGNATQAGPEGQFELRLARTGTYHVLACSHRVSRDANQPMDEKLSSMLGTFLEDPTAFLDQREYRYLPSVEYHAPNTELRIDPIIPVPSGEPN